MLELNQTIITFSNIIANQKLLPYLCHQLNAPYCDRSTVKENQTVCSPDLTDRVIKTSDRSIVKENQTICSPVLTDRLLKNSDRPIVKENQMICSPVLTDRVLQNSDRKSRRAC